MVLYKKWLYVLEIIFNHSEQAMGKTMGNNYFFYN